MSRSMNWDKIRGQKLVRDRGVEIVEIKRLPPGEALGARDLQNWSSRRLGGRSGTYDREEAKLLKKRAEKHKRKPTHDGAEVSLKDEVIARVTCRGCGRAVAKTCRMQDLSKLKCSACGRGNPKITMVQR